MNKLTAQDLINFFQEKPSFDKSETDSSTLYGWVSTHSGLYTITDIYKYFEQKGFTRKEIVDTKEKFQIQDSFIDIKKMEKGKTHILHSIRVKNFNKDYKKEPYFAYYFYDISKEEVLILKKEYEEQSRQLMLPILNKTVKPISISSANRKAKRNPTKKPALVD